MTRKKGTATRANCFKRERRAEARRGPHEAAAGEEREREDERQQRGSVGGPEPRSSHKDRVRGQRRTGREAPVQRAREDERRGQERERAEQDEDPVVVQRARERAPGSGGESRAREVGEVVPRSAVERCFLVVGRGVEALEPRVPVVMAVRVVAVQDQVAGDLDLVGRVVREVPGLARVPQPDLEQGGRDEQHRADDRRERDRRPAGPRTEVPGHRCGERDEEAGENCRRADDPEVPLAVGNAHERAEDAVRMDRGGRERPGVGAELRDRDRDDDAERRQQDERVEARHAPSMASLSARQSTNPAATAIASHVTGSSKNPL